MVARHFSDSEVADWLEGDSEAPIPQVSENLFHVPVSEDASADEVARLRVEEIMRELEEELRSVGAHARVATAEEEGTSVGEQAATASEEDGSVEAAEPVEPVEPEYIETDDIDEPEMHESHDEPEGSDEPDSDSVESTLVLDRDRLGGSVREKSIHDEELDERDERRRERLRVNPNPQDIQRKNALIVTPKEEPRRRFGFFAAIGAFVARVLRLDDR